MAITVIILLLLIVGLLIAYNFHIQKKIESSERTQQRINSLSILQDFMDIVGEQESVDEKIKTLKQEIDLLKQELNNKRAELTRYMKRRSNLNKED